MLSLSPTVYGCSTIRQRELVWVESVECEMRYGSSFRFGFGFSPFGFWLRGPGFFPRREEYIRMLEEYKRDLEAELRDVERELEELKKGS